MIPSTRGSKGRQADRSRRSLARFVDDLQARGRYTFRREEALSALGVSDIAFNRAARRLVAKRRLAAPRRGFFVVVPTEYSGSGAPPPSWFIADLMAFHGQCYYVGLLSAAALHGAAHQQPQEFQVMTDRALRPTTVGRARLRFFTKRHLRQTPTIDVKTYTGGMRVSTPESTALDLVRYVESAGHLDNVASVLAELAEVMDPFRLVEAARADIELTVIQRLGFLLSYVGATTVTELLARWLAEQRPRTVPLRADRASDEASKDSTWRVLVNDSIELDL